jgi:protein SCO1/2
MNRKTGFYIAFFMALFLVFYFTLRQIIPGYGKAKLPVLSYIQPFSFLNQEGKVISNRDVEGKVFVAEYFFTTCRGICPKMNNNLKQVYQQFLQEPDFLILSHTVDPLTDSVGRIREYADSMRLDAHKWWMLTGRKDSLYQMARSSYLLDDPKNNSSNVDEQFIHTQFFALVDRRGQVRKIYDGLKNQEILDLQTDIRRLLREANGQ